MNKQTNIFLLSFVFVAASCIVSSTGFAEEIEPTRKVVYKTIGKTKLQLDVFEPTGHVATNESPAIVFFFGGGWAGGTPKQFYEQSQFLADKGVVCFCANYRVKSRHKVTGIECVADAKSAIRYVRQHAKELGVNPNQIVAAGGSAGGHIAACTGVIDELDEPDEDANISSVPNAMILFNPVLDTTPETGFGWSRFPEGREQEASPCHHMKAGVAPTLLFHGTKDKTVPFKQATRFTKLMTDAGNRCELISFKDQGHGFFNGKYFRPKTKDTRPYQTTLKESVKFLESLGFIEPAVTESQKSKPNIVIIYTDDQGYGDVSALNPAAKFQTPNMDRIAKEGLAFTNGHSADSICTPSRYALLTGRYPWRTRMKTGVLGSEAKCLIDDKRLTLPKMLRQNGYHTGMVGKWHLGMDFPGERESRDWSKPVLDMPLDKGFDYFYGIPASLNFGILAWFEGRHAAVPPVLYTSKKKNPRHSDYRIMPPYEKTREESHAKRKRGGFEIAEDFVDDQCLSRFTDKAIEWLGGKVADAKEGKPFFLYLPYTSPHFPVCPLPEFQGKGDCGAYGEFLIETDHHIGRVLDFLKSSGVDDNTIVIFTCDNGPENPWKAHLKDYGHDSRGGYREGKRSVYEGGHRVPFLIRWPDGIKDPGRTCDGLVGQIDLMATIAEVVGTSLPNDAGEDSQSFAPVLFDASASHERLPLINHGNGGESRYAITLDNWKLIMPSKKHPKAELYNLAADKAEQNNVIKEHPDQVKKLKKYINQIITLGRTTPGEAQPNDTGYWKELFWMKSDSFETLTKQPQPKTSEADANDKNPQDDPDLPNVLLIGDSISQGYTPFVRGALSKKVDVFRIPSNGRASSFGVKKLDRWLKMNSHWDVIHFNWGLWDICYRHPKSKVQGRRDKVKGTLTTTEDDYRSNMEKLVARLKQTNAKLIWCATTPVPVNEAGRKVGDEIRYNEIAAEIMKANGIEIHDLHTHALQKLPEIASKPGDVHFTKAGYQHLAQSVAQTITTTLASEK